jgi:chromosomal replication initiation ATPase DnaA
MSTAAEIHRRLTHPAKAVQDAGIDLKRLPRGYFFQEKKILVQEYYPPPVKILNGNLILNAVSDAFRLGIKDILGKSRRPRVTLARHISIYFMYTIIPNTTLTTIGTRMNRDHTTCLHAIWKIENLLAQNGQIADFIRSIETSLLAQ